VATYVLVHGAWHGGWCWQRLAPLLRTAGHDVYTPTLTGLGERAHLLTPAVDLDTHAQDVAGLLEYEDLREVILVGHSYASMVITAVAERAAEHLSHLVYLDAFVPRDGECGLDFFSPEAQSRMLERARIEGEGWYLPAHLGERPFGITDETDIAWVRSKCTAHPLKTLQQPVRYANPAAAALPRTYILCTATSYFTRFAESARQEGRFAGWRYRELDAVHDAMVTAPLALADLLTEVTRPS